MLNMEWREGGRKESPLGVGKSALAAFSYWYFKIVCDWDLSGSRWPNKNWVKHPHKQQEEPSSTGIPEQAPVPAPRASSSARLKEVGARQLLLDWTGRWIRVYRWRKLQVITLGFL